jgi:hypothetical protein
MVNGRLASNPAGVGLPDAPASRKDKRNQLLA